ncbi:MAG TPA: hypothetical protein VMR33_13880 [Candidatus Baltobacteraceae bacterium]|jgi:sugar lactone lactonase YvrE|nr:hypothetical protein [Candidatus Baltobacteraceae bacterium]
MKPNRVFPGLDRGLIGIGILMVVLPLTGFGQANYAAPYTFTTIGTNFSYYPGLSSVAVDSKGNVYGGDLGGNFYYEEDIYELVPSGDNNWEAGNYVLPDAYSGYGSGLDYPAGVAVDGAGNMYAADTLNFAIRKVTPAGVVTTLAGQFGSAGFADGTGSAARFYYPAGIAVDSAGNLYVADTWNNAIRELTPDGTNWAVTTIAGSPPASYGSFGPEGGFADGTGSAAQFWEPEGLAVGTNGTLYVADTGNDAIRIVSPVGSNWVVTTLAGTPCSCCGIIEDGMTCGNVDGIGSAAQFNHPEGVAVDTSGNVYVADTKNYTIRKIAPNGDVTTLAGLSGPVSVIEQEPGSVDGTGSAARFGWPSGVAVDGEGNVYVADSLNQNFRKGSATVVQVVALEVTQVIQDWHNSIPLIQGKDTYVRAHLQLLPTNSGPVKVSEALLYGTGADGPLPGSPQWAINKPDNSVMVQTTNAADPDIRGRFANTLNFHLPKSWCNGTVTLQLAWPGGLQPTNVVPDDCSVQVRFVPAADPQIEFFAVDWTNADDTAYLVGGDLENLPLRVQSCYPVPKVTAAFFTLPWPSHTQPTVEEVNTQLISRQAFDSRYLVVDGVTNDLGFTNAYQDWIYHGAVATESTEGVKYDGLATGRPSFVSSSLVEDPYGVERQTASHEIGHNFGRNHDVNSDLFGFSITNDAVSSLGACDETGPTNYAYTLFQPFDDYPHGRPTLGPMTNGDNCLIYGLDTLTLNSTTAEAVVAPTNSPNGIIYCFDLMSYCDEDPEDVWPSCVTYTNLLNEDNLIFGSPPAQPQDGPRLALGRRRKGGPRPQGGGLTNYLMVRGIMDFNAGTAQFLPCLPLSTANTPIEPLAGTNFLLQALDDSGAVLQAVEFALEPSIVERGDPNQTAVFVVPLIADASIHTLELWYNGSPVATLTASPNAPTLTLTTPNGGQNFTTGTVNVAWTGSDADGDTLSYAVEYSADDGTTWRMLAMDWPGQTLGVNSSELAATAQGLIRVIASDGFNTASAQSAATFTVAPHAPSVWIDAPLDGSVFIGNIQLYLEATALDMQDGALDGTKVQWSSDRDGGLGEGDEVTFNARNLSEGYHTITVTATDSEGLTNSAGTHLFDLHLPPPALGFDLLPGTTNATLSWLSYYTNYVLQSSGSLASGWTTITNTPVVNTDTGQQTVSVAISNVNTFFRLAFSP